MKRVTKTWEPNISDIQWAWIAGIIEGEGSMGFSNGKPILSCQMTDEDTVQKLATLLECNCHSRSNGDFKHLHQIGLRATHKLMVIANNIEQHMSKRRTQSINNWRKFWEAKYN